MRRSCIHRVGITLMEVILALAIFLASLAVITRLVGHGTQAIQRARLESTASLLAESKMNEVTAGVISVADGGAEFGQHPQWKWRLSTSDGPIIGLQRVEVSVSPVPGSPLARFVGAYRLSLARWVLDETGNVLASDVGAAL